jgi:hypothetical protein
MLASRFSASLRTSALALACFAGTALAGPLDRSIVPAATPWVLHVDVEAAVASKVGSFMLSHKGEFDLDGLDGLKAFGIDAPRDLLSITIFSPDAKSEDGVVAVLATPAIDALWNHLKTEPHAKSITVDGVELLSWDDKGERKYGRVTPSADGKTRLALISDEWESIVAAIKGAKQAGNLAGPSKGSILFAQATTLPEEMIEDADDNGQAILSKVQSAWLDIGEQDATVRAIANATFTDATAASQSRDVLQGLLSFVRMVSSTNEDVKPIVQMLDGAGGPKISLDQGTKTLSIEFSAPSDKVAAGLAAMKENERDDADDEDEDHEDEDHGKKDHQHHNRHEDAKPEEAPKKPAPAL